MTNIYAALEIGTTQTVVLVGELDQSNRVRIIGKGVYPTTGVHKGQVVDIAHGLKRRPLSNQVGPHIFAAFLQCDVAYIRILLIGDSIQHQIRKIDRAHIRC